MRLDVLIVDEERAALILPHRVALLEVLVGAVAHVSGGDPFGTRRKRHQEVLEVLSHRGSERGIVHLRRHCTQLPAWREACGVQTLP